MATRKTKTLNQALDQSYRINEWRKQTGRQPLDTKSVGTVIGNMADRISMAGGDPFSSKYMDVKVGYKERTTAPTDEEYKKKTGIYEGLKYDPSARTVEQRIKGTRGDLVTKGHTIKIKNGRNTYAYNVG